MTSVQRTPPFLLGLLPPGFLSGRDHIRDQWAWTVSECEASGRQTFVDCDAGDS